jgi:anti-sigma regulatory factor (Ser/Thr protein kinase)
VAGGTRLDDETLLVVSREMAVVDPSVPGHEAGPATFPALEWLDRARSAGEPLLVPASQEELRHVRRWAAGHPYLGTLESEARSLVETALYETAANIVEHGYGSDSTKLLRLWWLSPQALGTCPAPDVEIPERAGIFLFLDHGVPFQADAWQAADFGDLDTRRRGRGFGLDIIHRAMSRVHYVPSTPEGNVTLLVFDPDALKSGERRFHHA